MPKNSDHVLIHRWSFIETIHFSEVNTAHKTQHKTSKWWRILDQKMQKVFNIWGQKVQELVGYFILLIILYIGNLQQEIDPQCTKCKWSKINKKNWIFFSYWCDDSKNRDNEKNADGVHLKHAGLQKNCSKNFTIG